MLERVVKRIASSISETTGRAVGQLIVYGILLFLAGTASSLLSTYMSEVLSPPCDGCTPINFKSVTVMLLIQCLGEMSCLLVYWCLRSAVSSKLIERRRIEFNIGNPDLPRAHWWHWIYIGCMDTTSTFLIFAAQAYLNTFTVSMIRCSSLFLCAVGCILVFRRNIRVSSWIGLFLICLGQILASIDAGLEANDNVSASSAHVTFGYTSIILGTIFASMFYVIEESMWVKYSFNPLKGTGQYGCTAFAVGIVLTLIADKIGWEKWQRSVHQIVSSRSLMIMTAVYIPILGILNFAALSATGVGSALFTATILATRPVCTWLIGTIRGTRSRQGLTIVGMCFIASGLIFYMGLVSRLFPLSIRRKLNSDLHMQCYILWDEDEYRNESSEEFEESYASSAAPTSLGSGGGFDKDAREKSLIPTILGKVNITKCADDFYQHMADDDDEWIAVDKEIEISIPQTDIQSTVSTILPRKRSQ